MAKTEQTAKDVKALEASESPENPLSKRKIFVFLVFGFFLLLSIGGGVAWFFLGKKGHTVQTAAEKAAQEEAHAKKTPPVFYTLERMTVNLQRNSSAEGAYLQVVIDLKLADAKLTEQVKQYAPMVNHEVVLLLSSKNAAWLEVTENKVKLANEIRDKVNGILKVTDPKLGVQAAYFSVFIIQ